MMIITLLVLIIFVVFIHELGHFIFAKLNDVKVEKFSIGFGNPIFKRKWGETEYILAWIPLGGFVKLLGEDPEGEINEIDKDRALCNKSPLRRMSVVLAGPIFNVIGAILLYMTIYTIGIEKDAPFIGETFVNEPAYEAGLRTGDMITKINDKPITLWEELQEHISKSPGKLLQITVKRDNSELAFSITPKPSHGKNMFGEDEIQGKIGILPNTYTTLIGISSPDSTAYKAGLRTGDKITNINGHEIQYFYELEKYFHNTKTNIMTILRSGQKLDISTAGSKDVNSFGVEPALLYLSSIHGENSPFKTNDKIIGVNGKTITNRLDLFEAMETIKGPENTFVISRDGKNETINLTLASVKANDVINPKKMVFDPGFKLNWESTESVPIKIQSYNPITLLTLALKDTKKITKPILVLLKKLFTREVGTENLGSIIMIGKVAQKAAEVGLLSFINFVAFVSINLGIINLLPILPLDGGHIRWQLTEIIARYKPNPKITKVMQYEAVTGTLLLVLLFVVVFFNDIKRYSSEIFPGFF